MASLLGAFQKPLCQLQEACRFAHDASTGSYLQHNYGQMLIEASIQHHPPDYHMHLAVGQVFEA